MERGTSTCRLPLGNRTANSRAPCAASAWRARPHIDRRDAYRAPISTSRRAPACGRACASRCRRAGVAMGRMGSSPRGVRTRASTFAKRSTRPDLKGLSLSCTSSGTRRFLRWCADAVQARSRIHSREALNAAPHLASARSLHAARHAHRNACARRHCVSHGTVNGERTHACIDSRDARTAVRLQRSAEHLHANGAGTSAPARSPLAHHPCTRRVTGRPCIGGLDASAAA